MKPRSLLLSTLLIWSLASAYSTAAQGPGQRRRYFSNQARPYYRGPFRVTVGGGVALYSGDLGGLSQNLPGASISLGGLYLLRPRLLVGGEASYFQIGATDQLPERNLAFRGRNSSLTTFLRYELFGDESQFAAPRSPAAVIKPYVKAGVGLVVYNPKTYNGTGRPVNEFGFLPPESASYPNVAVIAPVGGGLTFRLSRDFSATAEAVYNFTSTDLLDDVSRRGNAAKKDGYGSVELKIEYAIR